MRKRLGLLLLAALASAEPQARKLAVAECKARRARLARDLGEDYALVLGQPPTDVMAPRQEGHFLYLTGVTDPGASLLLAGQKAAPLRLTPKRSGTETRELLLLRWVGARYAQFHALRYRPGPATAKALGIETTGPAPRRPEELARLVARLLPRGSRLHVPAYGGSDQAFVREIRRKLVEALARIRDDLAIVDLQAQLMHQRSIKSAYEIERITRAVAITHAAFRAALASIRPHSSEAAVDAALLAAVRRRQARPAYPFVVAGGAHAPLPHYFRNSGPLREGDLLVIDAGAAVSRYAADITRTFPVSGHFTPRQAEIYAAVLAAQRAAIEQVRPGVSLRRVHAAAKRVLARAGLDRYFIHGTSHHVGLDVHDPGPDLLEVGMLITVEPGVYILEERIGVRIEDIVEVTERGHRVVGAPFPKTLKAIEAMLAKR